MNVREHYDLPPKDFDKLPVEEFICGCEFEIEDVRSIPKSLTNLFVIEIDNSLRNNGREFKTPPLNFEETLERFQTLHKELGLGPKAFTERTSVHVHVNVRNLSLKQVNQLILCYALLEPLFFDFVGVQRKNSIFCVPLSYTAIPSSYNLPATKLKEKWHKYTAFNISPMGPHGEMPGLGTVEFRHLYGTNDFLVFQTWLSAIRELYSFVATQPNLNILKEMSNQDTTTLVRKIIPTFCVEYTDKELKTVLKDSQLDVKLSAGGFNKT